MNKRIILSVNIIFLLLCSCKPNKKIEIERKEKIITDLILQHNADLSWQKIFHDYEITLDNGSRWIYSVDVENAFIRSEKKATLIIGDVFEVKKIDEDNYYIGITSEIDYDLHFILQCNSQNANRILSQSIDQGSTYAIVAKLISVKRPLFEADAYVENIDEESDPFIIIEPGDVYLIYGDVVEIKYIGELWKKWEEL
jgi:hypothetical protein